MSEITVSHRPASRTPLRLALDRYESRPTPLTLACLLAAVVDTLEEHEACQAASIIVLEALTAEELDRQVAR